MKLYEMVEYTDGGPNDRGTIVGYVEARNREHAKVIKNINHNFIQFFEISEKEFRRRKKKIEDKLRLFNIKRFK